MIFADALSESRPISWSGELEVYLLLLAQRIRSHGRCLHIKIKQSFSDSIQLQCEFKPHLRTYIMNGGPVADLLCCLLVNLDRTYRFHGLFAQRSSSSWVLDIWMILVYGRAFIEQDCLICHFHVHLIILSYKTFLDLGKAMEKKIGKAIYALQGDFKWWRCREK